MKDVVFITGNQKKAEYLSNLIGHDIAYQKVDLDEIQSLDLHQVVRHKVRQAYELVRRPVLVEDVSLEFKALGRLPGTFIKWFIEEMTFSEICSLLDGKDRSAVVRTTFGYFDGEKETFFDAEMKGEIAKVPAGSGGFGWDPIFIPEGYSVTRAELSLEDDKATYLKAKPILEVKAFLSET